MPRQRALCALQETKSDPSIFPARVEMKGDECWLVSAWHHVLAEPVTNGEINYPLRMVSVMKRAQWADGLGPTEYVTYLYHCTTKASLLPCFPVSGWTRLCITLMKDIECGSSWGVLQCRMQ